MLTTVSFPSLRLGMHPTMDFSVSLIGCHVVHLHQTDMDCGSFLMEVLFKSPVQGMATTFYRTRGDDGTVNLNRLNTNVFTPTGLFCCEVPNAIGAMQRLCANIGELISHQSL